MKTVTHGVRQLSLVLLVVLASAVAAAAQTTTFTYQGKLSDDYNQPTGLYDLQFNLYNEASGTNSPLNPTPIIQEAVQVTFGAFTVMLDFGNLFNGSNRYLEIGVRVDGSTGAFTLLSPRQLITSAPYALRSLSAATADTATNAQNLGGTAPGSFVLNTDSRLTDARTPTAGSSDYIWNSTIQQASSNFNISGTGTAANLTASGTLAGNLVNATTQFNIGGNRVLSVAGTNNIFTGNAAGSANTTGSANSFFGANAGLSNTTGSNNTTIGSSANVGANNLSYATAIGANAVVSASNTIVLGRSAGEDTVQIPGNLNIAGTISGSVSGAGLTNLNASNITSGTLADARLSSNVATLSAIQTFTGAITFAGGISGNGSGLTGINASNITTGTLNNARLGVIGVANGGTGLTAAGTSGNFLRSNGTGFISSALTAADVPDLSANYIRNQTGTAQSGGFNISGTGTVATLTASGTLSGSIVNAATQFNLGGNRVLSVAGTNNIFAGNGAGNSNTTGEANSFFGAGAGASNTTGTYNSFVGVSAGQSNTTANANSFFGYQAGIYNNTGTANSFVGTFAGFSNTSGNYNSFFGGDAGRSNTTGYQNAFAGYQAGQLNTTGYNNSFFGVGAGNNNTAGSSNSFVGNGSGYSNTTGNSNSFMGAVAGNFNTTGFYNAFVGNQSGYNNTTGNSNSFFGMNAGLTNTTGSSNTIIGASANVGSNNLVYATALGAEATVSTSNTIVLGRSAGQDTVRTPGLLQLNTLGTAGSAQLCRNAANQIATCSSSLRYKTDIMPFTFGLNLVQRLRPIIFTWKDSRMKDLGFGAEEVAAIHPLLVTYNASGIVEGVKYDRISAVLVNAVKEQQTQIETQQTQLNQQQSQLQAQQQQLKQQQTVIEGLKQLLCQQNPKADVCR